MSDGARYQDTHASLLYRQDKASRELQADMARRISEAVQEACAGREVMDAGCYHKARRAIDLVMDEYYGQRPGDTRAKWLTVVLQSTGTAYEAARLLAAATITRHLTRFDPELLEALKDMADE